jgi:hypothetical protein
MGLSTDLDLGGLTIVCKQVKTGYGFPNHTSAENLNVAAGSTLTLVPSLHAGRTINLDTLTGSVVTLPASTGSGDRYRFVVSVVATSNSHIVKVANASDIILGGATMADTDGTSTIVSFIANGSTHDTITLNRTTTGSVTIGENFTLVDYGLNKWLLDGWAVLSNTGTAATPFSATV